VRLGLAVAIVIATLNAVVRLTTNVCSDLCKSPATATARQVPLITFVRRSGHLCSQGIGIRCVYQGISMSLENEWCHALRKIACYSKLSRQEEAHNLGGRNAYVFSATNVLTRRHNDSRTPKLGSNQRGFCRLFFFRLHNKPTSSQHNQHHQYVESQ